ncbi:MAG: hypothetical protein OEQ18_06345 [Gammaproteobacteria bacterium]|nr:hypothetical protein [Gammaproteobacteria bacterium]
MRDVTKEDSASRSTYYTDHDVGVLLGISLGRLRNKLCAGSPLPPRIQPPGSRHRLWRRGAVHAWLEQFTVTVADPVNVARRTRGRPRKQEERLRSR